MTHYTRREADLDAALATAETALRSAIAVAEEARQEWDAAPGPPAVKSGKLLIALAGHIKGYRKDIDEIHAALAQIAEARKPRPDPHGEPERNVEWTR